MRIRWYGAEHITKNGRSRCYRFFYQLANVHAYLH
jgi:hypothetical protein